MNVLAGFEPFLSLFLAEREELGEDGERDAEEDAVREEQFELLRLVSTTGSSPAPFTGSLLSAIMASSSSSSSGVGDGGGLSSMFSSSSSSSDAPVMSSLPAEMSFTSADRRRSSAVVDSTSISSESLLGHDASSSDLGLRDRSSVRPPASGDVIVELVVELALSFISMAARSSGRM